MVRSVLMAVVNGGRVLGRPRLSWMDDVDVALDCRRMTLELRDNYQKIGRIGEPYTYVHELITHCGF